MELTARAKHVRKIIQLLNQAQAKADALELKNGGGGEIGSLIGSIADELECDLEDGRFDK